MIIETEKKETEMEKSEMVKVILCALYNVPEDYDMTSPVMAKRTRQTMRAKKEDLEERYALAVSILASRKNKKENN